jgi:phosphohistidine phosphatase SixA
VRALEIRRHAQREKDEDRLSDAGRDLAARVASTTTRSFDRVFVSPAARASEPARLADVLGELFGELPDDSRALVVGHTPLIEKSVAGLTGREIAPLSECEGVLIVEEGGEYRMEELRL